MTVLQFGGAAGTLASLGARASQVEAALADELGLARARHARGTRSAIACATSPPRSACMIATLGKLARDISLLAQTEVGEAFEPAAPGRGGSSTLPHKRNPVGCAIALAAAVRAPGLVATMLAAAVQEHERGLGDWPAEWDALPQIVRCSPPARSTAMARRRRGTRRRRRAHAREPRHRRTARSSPRRCRWRSRRTSAATSRTRSSPTLLGKRARAERRHLRDVLERRSARDALCSTRARSTRLIDPAQYLGLCRRVRRSRARRARAHVRACPH